MSACKVLTKDSQNIYRDPASAKNMYMDENCTIKSIQLDKDKRMHMRVICYNI
jgi:hypothetical protein